MNDLQKAILDIQLTLKAPKSQFNSFANYYYRNAEDILEALKPLLKKHNLFQKVSDEVVNIGNANYVKSTVYVSSGELTESASGYAREEESLKGQIAAQITGGASSYAKKYALNNMWNIDDTKDADSQDSSKDESKQTDNKPKYPSGAPTSEKAKQYFATLKFQINGGLNTIGYSDDEKKNFIFQFLNKESIDTIEEAKEILNEVQALLS